MGNLTKVLVDKLKMTKYALAKKVGVTWATVQHWYIGRFQPETENLKKLKQVWKERK